MATRLWRSRKCKTTARARMKTNVARKQNQCRECCKNANAFACRCPNAKCIFVRRGRFLTCRNDETRHDQVCEEGCNLRCFGTFQFCRNFSKHIISHLQISIWMRSLLKRSFATALERSTSKTAATSTTIKTAVKRAKFSKKRTIISPLSRKTKSRQKSALERNKKSKQT